MYPTKIKAVRFDPVASGARVITPGCAALWTPVGRTIAAAALTSLLAVPQAHCQSVTSQASRSTAHSSFDSRPAAAAPLAGTAAAARQPAAQVDMIELQTIVSQRATTAQMTNGVLQSVRESQQTIAGNITSTPPAEAKAPSQSTTACKHCRLTALPK
jgi:hypothetical protein